jgi:hypothetical protein
MAKTWESSILVPMEPKTYLQATKSLQANQWMEAMQQEYNSLIHNGTWSLIDLPASRNAMQNKWVFKLKMATDSNVAQFKARLIAKGFSQREGINYSEAFSPIIKFDSIRTIMSIVATNNLMVKQFDIETAFLYNDIEEQIYMHQPTGFTNPVHPQKVCLMQKSLYVLEQSACNWNRKFNQNLQLFGLQPILADPCMFVGGSYNNKIILAIFIDDRIICNLNEGAIDQVLHHMRDKFKLTTRVPKVYVGLHIEHDMDQRVLQLDQTRYITKKLVEFGFTNCIPVSVPAYPHA